jgi:UDP-N-acetyl-D-glucosamine/UDP-N-acetyl-D-galactosamine dehydrogenase
MEDKICLIGLGYVGLPLMVALAKNKYTVIGYDISQLRLSQLQKGHDTTYEIDKTALDEITEYTHFTNDLSDARDCSIFIVTVPTPINADKSPDLKHLEQASRDIGRVIKKGATVVYESTVYPGATEEICVPLVEEHSGLRFNKDFFVGFSPERINPGDKHNTIDKIVKVIGASNDQTLTKLNNLYSGIISAGTYCTSSIKVAEAAKVIENTQRDLNIALVNELSKVFEYMGIDTTEVLDAASTKWNFMPFFPGLVGGHCIGVDPYYLTHKAEQLNYHPELILAGRRINDTMPEYITGKVLQLCNKSYNRKMDKVLVLGVTFKANCPDIRNSKSIDLIRELTLSGYTVDACDPWLENTEIPTGPILNMSSLKSDYYDIIIISVDHQNFKDLGADHIASFGKNDALICDLKAVFHKDYNFWRL